MVKPSKALTQRLIYYEYPNLAGCTLHQEEQECLFPSGFSFYFTSGKISGKTQAGISHLLSARRAALSLSFVYSFFISTCKNNELLCRLPGPPAKTGYGQLAFYQPACTSTLTQMQF
jgi:hypothetical protein